MANMTNRLLNNYSPAIWRESTHHKITISSQQEVGRRIIYINFIANGFIAGISSQFVAPSSALHSVHQSAQMAPPPPPSMVPPSPPLTSSAQFSHQIRNAFDSIDTSADEAPLLAQQTRLCCYKILDPPTYMCYFISKKYTNGCTLRHAPICPNVSTYYTRKCERR
jgi:hypothetical protein